MNVQSIAFAVCSCSIALLVSEGLRDSGDMASAACPFKADATICKAWDGDTANAVSSRCFKQLCLIP